MKDALPKIDWQTLYLAAENALGSAYAPYSNFKVGAALLTLSGDIITGCNMENASFGLTQCAERNAMASAVRDNHRKFVALSVVSLGKVAATPCGACRQVLREFAQTLPIGCKTPQSQWIMTDLDLLLPMGFGPEFLQ